MEKIYGSGIATVFTLMILWTAFGSVFALLLGYSRIPYAAARDGYFFKPFARLHPRGDFPYVSLLVLGVISVLACLMSLGTVIDSIVSLGSVISGAHVERSVLGPWAIVGSGAHVADSILFDRARIEAGATVQRAILDKEVVVEAGAHIGVDRAEDLARGFIVTDSGITVVGKGSRVRVSA